jgi:predicted transposase YdaD
VNIALHLALDLLSLFGMCTLRMDVSDMSSVVVAGPSMDQVVPMLFLQGGIQAEHWQRCHLRRRI